MSLSHRTQQLERRAPPFTFTLSDGRELKLASFAGTPVVLGLFARPDTIAFSEKVLQEIRAELRGLGAVLALIGRDGAWCFRPDDELEVLASAGEIGEAELTAVFEAYGLTSQARGGGHDRALYVIDHEGRVSFHCYADPGEDLSELVNALRAAGRALLAPARPL